MTTIALVLLLGALGDVWPSGNGAQGVQAGVASTAEATAAASMRGTRRGTVAESVTRLDLGFGTAGPGTEVTLPMVLEVPQGVQVGKTVSEIAFPSSVLTFEKATPGVAAELAEAKIETDVRPDRVKTDTSIVTVSAASAGRAISSGIVATLFFRLSQTAPAGQTITLVHRPRAFTTGTKPQSVDPIAGRNGEIEVSEAAPAAIACFFYMH